MLKTIFTPGGQVYVYPKDEDLVSSDSYEKILQSIIGNYQNPEIRKTRRENPQSTGFCYIFIH